MCYREFPKSCGRCGSLKIEDDVSKYDLYNTYFLMPMIPISFRRSYRCLDYGLQTSEIHHILKMSFESVIKYIKQFIHKERR